MITKISKILNLTVVSLFLSACINSSNETGTNGYENEVQGTENSVNNEFMNHRNLVSKKPVNVKSIANKHNDAKTIEISNSKGTHKIVLSTQEALDAGVLNIENGSSKNPILVTITLENGKVLKEKIKWNLYPLRFYI